MGCGTTEKAGLGRDYVNRGKRYVVTSVHVLTRNLGGVQAVQCIALWSKLNACMSSGCCIACHFTVARMQRVQGEDKQVNESGPLRLMCASCLSISRGFLTGEMLSLFNFIVGCEFMLRGGWYLGV